MRIMIVDDQPRMRAAIRDSIASVCRDVVECGSAEEALERFSETHPDWVTMDYRMEPTDGITGTTRLLQRHPGARVLIVTNYDETELRTAAAEAGAVGFVLKENLLSLADFLRAHSTDAGLA